MSNAIEELTKRNKELNEEKLKCDKTLNQHRTDKDLLFIKLNNLKWQNDKLKNLIQSKKESKITTPSSMTTNHKNNHMSTTKKTNKNNNEARFELKKEEIDISKKRHS